MAMPIILHLRDRSRDRQGLSILGRFSDCDLILRKVYEVLDLTPIKLARLIGMSSPTNAYHWIKGRHRPSQAYLLRICYLLCLQQEGVNLKRLRTINWETHQMEWWEGVEPNERPTVGGTTWRDLPIPP